MAALSRTARFYRSNPEARKKHQDYQKKYNNGEVDGTRSHLERERIRKQNKARRAAIKAGKVKRNDGKDVSHKKGRRGRFGKGDTTIKSASVNRGEREASRLRGSKRRHRRRA